MAAAIMPATIAAACLFPLAPPARAQQVTTEMILNDPQAPVAGNPKGDVTIVYFTDYNCPYCKKIAPVLDRVVREDGKIRLVYKDWPVIRPTSIEGAVLVLAAKYQGKYKVAHDALMKLPGSNLTREQMRTAIQKAGVNMPRLDKDLATHEDEILDLIKRNMAQGDALELTGTPTFLIGPFRTPALDYDGFREAIADARARQAAER
ncbi:DsbA family protein [Xanthobacter sp. TB0136]|uniref:DsbA family protein n=1 Tax=Xanthobacter sp. TB0136 TaxID=3459177 RepID=UPI004039F219